MAMPPGGGSSWHHTSNSYQLIGDDGAVWAAVSVPLAHDQLTLMFPHADSAHDLFHVLTAAAENGRVMLTSYHPLSPEPRPVRWMPTTPAHELVPHPDIRRRGKWDGHVADAPLVARVEAAPGAITVFDAGGRARMLLRLGSDEDAVWPAAGERGLITSGGATLARFCLPTGPGAGVRVVATSMP